MKNKSRKNEKNLLKNKSEYSYVIDSFGGYDARSAEGKCDDSRFPYLLNMYRDRERRGGSGIETFPGYRSLPKTMGGEGEKIYGLYSHRFAGKEYLLVHKGRGLYIFSADSRDSAEALSSVYSLAERESAGFSFGDSFYLLDGESLIRVSSPTEAVALGDEDYTEEMAEAGLFPETTAYIPTAYENGVKKEPRNLLTDYYDLKYTLKPDDPTDRSHGLYLGLTTYNGEEALEVYGFEKGRSLAFVPETAEYRGRVLPIRSIAPGAFKESEVTTVILSPAVKLVDGIEEMNYGAFYGCSSLKEVVLYGVETVGADAFALCPALEKVVFGVDPTIAATAFYGCTSLRTVFTADEFKGVSAYFGEDVTVYANTALAYGKVGDTIRIPCMNDVYSRIYTLYGGEFEALSDFSSYVGIYDEVTDQNEGYSVRALRSAPLVECYMQHSAGDDHSRYVFITVTEADGLLSYRDKMVSYTLPAHDLCRSLVTVTLDGEELHSAYKASGYFTILSEKIGERTYIKAIRVILPNVREGERSVFIRVYGKNGSYDEATVYDTFPAYTGSSFDLIRKCRKAAVYDGRVFLADNPELPRAIFYSVASSDGGEVYFSPDAYLTLAEDGAEELLSHPAYLAILLKRGGIRFVTPSGTDYKIAGGFGTAPSLGKSLLFRDDPVFLSTGGLYGIGDGKLWEESRLENRSALVATAFPKKFESASMVEWKGYLALLFDGEIFLADGDATVTVEGESCYEWYRLTDIGHYLGDSLRYHHLSVSPFEGTVTVEGMPLSVLGEELEFEGEVLTGVCQPDGVAVAYGYLDGVPYLLDTDGERVGGVFSPATHLAVCGDLLFFASSDGYVSVFNTDKRGVSPTVGGKTLACREDEIHSYFYTFDGHRYPSGFATSYADMGVPHLTKSTVQKSVVFRVRARSGSAFSVYVRCDRGVWDKLADITATSIRDGIDFTKFSFHWDEGQSLLVHEHKRGWVDKQYLIFSSGFRAPFAINGIAYRYTVDGRPKS